MVGGPTFRPRPPSPIAIAQDIVSALSTDPVFRKLSDATGERFTKDVAERSSNQPLGIDVSYQKVHELLDNLSLLRTEKDRLNKATEELLACRDDVSAVSLELKTRLKMHKAASTKGNH